MSGHEIMSEITKPIVHQLSAWGTYLLLAPVVYSLTNYQQICEYLPCDLSVHCENFVGYIVFGLFHVTRNFKSMRRAI